MQENENMSDFIQKNSPDGGFLQSSAWQKFQESVGRKAFSISLDVEKEKFQANVVEHILPIVGKYFYSPRGPVMKQEAWNAQYEEKMLELINLAKSENAGWIRIEPATQEILDVIKKHVKEKIIKAPHDMQPKEILAIDISKSAEQLLMEMKSKTRYNIGVARKRGVRIFSISKQKKTTEQKDYIEEFLRLNKEMALRNGIATHADEYYKKMFEILPDDMFKIYVAEFEGKIIAANLVLFYGRTVTYLHGASGKMHRNLMAPFLLQWQSILDAKEKGCTHYDFGGVNSGSGNNSWEGITNFKLGFSLKTKPLQFPGSYDIIINPRRYAVYRGLQRAKAFAVRFKK
ncbi:MAG: methicillin resistance protein [uncultured bacterium]|nr:MAG: methicillin resistance protein [uncultured bacterium]